MKTRELRYSIRIAATPRQVYDALMDAKKHAAFTGYSARIDPKVGGYFVTCGNRNCGYNLVLDPAKRIVQAWSQRSFHPRYTIIDIKLKKEGKGTRLEFLQTGAPTSAVTWLRPGWHQTYWEPLKAYFAHARGERPLKVAS